MKASIVDLRYKMKDILKALSRGESVTVLYHGKEHGILLPVKSGDGKTKNPSDSAAFGIWKAHLEKRNVAKYLRELRGPRY